MKSHGPCIYRDTSSKGKGKRHKIWRADITVNGTRMRARSHSREVLAEWLRGHGACTNHDKQGG